MSGRFTFTAGSTLTAAQLNTNVMDGIPYKIVAGSNSVNGSLAVTFPVSFTTGVTPVVTLGLQSTTSAATGVTWQPSATPSAGMTLYTWVGSAASTSARTVWWTAIQMTSSSGTGNS